MNTVVKIQPRYVGTIPYQEASFDIWDKKYRLTAKDGTPVDGSMDDTYKRVARALADVESEETREHWYEQFLWALRHGAIPAGRVTSNAGALEHKPATSTINCTVSGTIRDSMDDILKKVHEAGLTLKAGCVAPGTWVRTDRGLVTADEAVRDQHREILSYDLETGRFEMRRILRHMTTHVPRHENIRIKLNGLSLTTVNQASRSGVSRRRAFVRSRRRSVRLRRAHPSLLALERGACAHAGGVVCGSSSRGRQRVLETRVLQVQPWRLGGARQRAWKTPYI